MSLAKLSAGALLALSFGACVSDDIAEGKFTCFHVGSRSECPDNLVCASDLFCRKSASPGDGGAGVGNQGGWVSGGSGGVAGVAGIGGAAGNGAVPTGGGGGTDPVCGNGVVESGEACDPCLCDDGDGCTTDLTLGCAGCDHPSACQSNQVCVSGNCTGVACVRRLWRAVGSNLTHWFGLVGTSPPGSGWNSDTECAFRVYTSPNGSDQQMYSFENSDNGLTRYRYRVANDDLGVLWSSSSSPLGGYSSLTQRPGEIPLFVCWRPCCAKTAHVFGDHILTTDQGSCAGWQTEDNYPVGFGINRWVLPP